MDWIRKHKRFSSILAVVLILCVLMSYSYSAGGSSTALGQGVQKVTTTITSPLTTAATGMSNFFTGVFSYHELQKENEELKERINDLEAENLELQLTAQELVELQALYEAFSFEPYSASSNALAARIIEIDWSTPYVVFTIDVGSEDGVEKDDVVTNGEGLVGRVSSVGETWAKVISVLSDGNNIGFRVLRDSTITGVVTGNGADALEGYVLDNTARIVKGDVLVTTGIGIYPAGIRIGTVTSVEYDDDRQMKIITVEPTVDFDGLQKVAVFL